MASLKRGLILIPQAFTTRDTTEAYKWLQTLPPSVKDEMKSMEQVVSLYLRAKRLGGGVPTSEELNVKNGATKNPEDFQKSLKDIQMELEKFNLGPDPSATSQAKVAHDLAAPSTVTVTSATTETTSTTATIASSLRFDPKSREIISEIRDGLNLSSDMEVLRLSLIIARKNLDNLLD
jgi:hypothetical protein